MKSSRRRKTMRKQRAGGYADVLPMVYPGGLTHQQYSGPGYDCPGVPVRPGHISGPGGPGGLPGLSLTGGGRAGNMTALGGGAFTTGAIQELKQMGGRRRRGKKTQRRRKTQRGGRWQSAPELGALNPLNGVGAASYAPILRAPCETGTHNALNPNPNNVQGLSTAVGNMPGWTPMGPGAPAMRGGAHKRQQKRQQKKKGGSRKQRGGMFVGDFNNRAYYAPTAGYANSPLAPPVHNNPGILMQVGYPARAFNQACMATH